LLVGAIVILMMGFNYKYLIKAKEIPKTEKKNHFQNQIALIYLGLIGFLLYGDEGVMFDWSGVYFKDVIHAPGL
jgi:hypothetical protein